jgi:hypothetical protein
MELGNNHRESRYRSVLQDFKDIHIRQAAYDSTAIVAQKPFVRALALQFDTRKFGINTTFPMAWQQAGKFYSRVTTTAVS